MHTCVCVYRYTVTNSCTVFSNFQSCLSIACHFAVERKRNTVYIDTGGEFSSKRIEEILQKKNEGQNEMVTTVQRMYDSVLI